MKVRGQSSLLLAFLNLDKCMAFASPLMRSSSHRISTQLLKGLAFTRGGSALQSSTVSASPPQDFIDNVNVEYEVLHKAFEMQFWGTKMALASETYSTGELSRTKEEMESFLASMERLDTTRVLLSQQEQLTEQQIVTLKLFERTFSCYIMESETARSMRKECTAIEGDLESARNDLILGANLPSTAAETVSASETTETEFVELSSVGLRSRMRVDSDERVRKACFQGLRKIGDFVLTNGFVELVKTRNAMAKELGYQDYYDYKVTQAEGFGKETLFEILDELERDTRPLMEAARAKLSNEKGAGALEPWNTGYLMAGETTSKLDPYFPFEKAVENWGRSFSALGITYKGATMDLDLLDRKRKYSNGFCHWPQPAWRRGDGSWQPSVAHFTSLADPSAVGSGLTALTTLMHEAGHAAHFANIDMPSPLFSQERAPTSVPYAELQSMFLDSLVGDAAWRAKYAKNRQGQPLPWELIEEDIRGTHPYKVMALRSMLAVPFFEKALYELEDVTAEAITQLADRVEVEVQGGLGARPLLSVPHLLSDEASCYYHGYVLAEMAVHQTRDYFKHRDGFIVDNPSVGPTLAAKMWAPGNSQRFLELVEGLTEKPLSGAAWVAGLSQDTESLLEAERMQYAAAVAPAAIGDLCDDVDLDMRVRLVDGDEVIADTADGEEEGSSRFLNTCAKFETYIQARFAK
mmetsp:Transcript_7012/g.12949  ORF Transcript_7012/g.12949 Transcript_7012/m.12949 type:complete len:694 (-) Transcript_7012:303-2384(-)